MIASPGDSLPISKCPGRTFPLALYVGWTCSRGIPLPRHIHYSIGAGVFPWLGVPAGVGAHIHGSDAEVRGLGPRVPFTFCFRQGLPLARQLALVPPGCLN